MLSVVTVKNMEAVITFQPVKTNGQKDFATKHVLNAKIVLIETYYPWERRL